MEYETVIKILDPQFGYWAKSNGELLYTHHFAVWSIFKKLSGFCPSLDDKEKEDVEIACLVHDIGKMRDENQQKLKNNEDQVSHRIEEQDLKEYFHKVEILNEILSDERIKRIRDIVHAHHGVAEHDLMETTTPGASFFTNLLRTADYIASMEAISLETLSRLRDLYRDKIDFTYFSFSRFASPTTFMVVDILIKSYTEKGWQLIRTFENGALFVSQPKTALPEKGDCLEKIHEEVVKNSLSLQKPFPDKYRGDFLTLLSKKYPDAFLGCNKERVLDALGTTDKKAVVFFKLARDILSARGLIPKDLTKNLREGKINDPWILGIIESANSTRAHKYSKELYKKFTKKEPPEKVNRQMIDPLFDIALVENLFPSNLALPVDSKTRLSTLKPTELFEILTAVAKPQGEKQKSDLMDYLSACISMDEETDFRKLAKESFKRYCSYKKTADAEKGVCEICGCPISQKMQRALNPSKASEAFSQIKAKYDYRAICPLCGLDNLILREGVGMNQNRVYLRLETKVPDILLHHQEIERLIALVAAGIINPRNIVKFKERPELCNLPFPERIEIPIGTDRDAKKFTKKPIMQTDNGVLFIIGRDIPVEDYSPKDLKVKYEPLYHIMKYLGFKVSIGAEEQDGLFGEDVLTDEKGENYYLSLATILLANIIGKTQKQFIFARNLILNSPSTTLMSLADMQEDKEKRKMFSREQFELYTARLIRALKMANVKILTSKGGALTMDGLLKDAAFFADRDKGIPYFCVEPEERGNFWKDLTKHKAGKPVAQALDAIMSGLAFDIVMERFMRNLSVKIEKEKQGELKDFIDKTREILKRYYELRQSDLSGFLKAKNSLLSAIFILTRYQNIKEVVNE